MAFPFLAFFGGAGLATSLFEGIAGNSRLKKQAAAASAAEDIRASDRRDQQAKQVDRNVGRIAAGNGERRAYGRSSKAILLNQLAGGSKGEESIEADRDFRILTIEQQAANNRVDLISASIGGLSAGLNLGANFGDAI